MSVKILKACVDIADVLQHKRKIFTRDVRRHPIDDPVSPRGDDGAKRVAFLGELDVGVVSLFRDGCCRLLAVHVPSR